ncbi:MAG: dodecin [Halanaerobiales bacterium]|nr:dodecin [Halanaerobiales bacterium]
MSTTVKIIELVGESDKSWEDAVQNVVREASKTIEGITGVEILNMTADVKDGELYDYKVNVQIAFPVKNR